MSAGSRTKAFAVLFCLTIVSISGCGTSDKKVSSASGGDGTKETTTTAAASDDEPPAETTTTEAKAASGSAIEVSETGFSVYKDYDDSSAATAGAVLKNTGDDTAEYFEVVFSFKDASGKPVGTETATVYGVGAGETGFAEVQGVDLTGEPTTVDASAVVDDGSFFDTATVPVTVEGVTKEEYGDGVEVKGIANNDTEEVYESFSLTCVLRAGGKIVGGASGYLDTLVPGGAISWTATGPVQADAAECAAAGTV